MPSLQKFKTQNIWSKMFFFFWDLTPAKVAIYQRIHLSDWRAFWYIVTANIRKFFRTLTSLKKSFLCAKTFGLGFSVWIQLFARFTEYRIYNHWDWFVLWREHRKRNYADFLLLLRRWRCLLNQRFFHSHRRGKTLQILVEFS